MPRAGDLQLLALAAAVGMAVGWVATLRPARRIGAVAVLAALLLALVGDRRLHHAVPSDLVVGSGQWVAGAAVAVAVGWGARRLPTAPTAGVPPVLPLALASLVGVWAGVPETSGALLAAGVLTGLGLAVLARAAEVTPLAAVVIAVAPVVAVLVGAVGEPHAVVGGLLCSGTLVVLGAGPVVPAVPARALAAATGLQLVGALLAARQVGITRDWLVAMPAIALVVGLAVVGAVVLRQGQGRTTS